MQLKFPVFNYTTQLHLYKTPVIFILRLKGIILNLVHACTHKQLKCFCLSYRAFAFDVTAAMLVFQDKRILMRCFCQVHQYGRHLLCCLVPQGQSANALYQYSIRRCRLQFHKLTFPQFFLCSTLTSWSDMHGLYSGISNTCDHGTVYWSSIFLV